MMLAMIYVVFLILLIVFLSSNALFYLIYVPANTKNTRDLVKQKFINLIIWVADILSVLRLPFAVIPYLVKVIFYLALRKNFKVVWASNISQSIRIMGDFFNLGISFLFWYCLMPERLLTFLVFAALAEIIRLVLEKGFIIFSVFWQHLPLEDISKRLLILGMKSEWLLYYSRPLSEKTKFIQNTISYFAQDEPRFRYFSRFKILDSSDNLRMGHVREIANGNVFIHKIWVNDPWLSLGICTRRTPWIFDPRYLPRPFYYRSQANRLMTEFVLEYSAVFPPFSFYQFGHEIKSARFELFFKLARRFGVELEQYVQKDGSYFFDPLIINIGYVMGFENKKNDTTIQNDSVAIFETTNKIDQGQKATPAMVAEEYSYPLIYVEEVLWQKIESAKAVNLQKNY